MKKIIVLFLFFLSFGNIYATEISVELNKNIVTEGEVFELSVGINDLPLDTDNLNFSIPGIENFDIFAQSRSSSTQMINGEVSSLSIFTLSLMPQMPGEYEIGPVSYELEGEQISDDEVISLEVRALAPRIPEIERDERVTQNNQENEDIRPLREVPFPLMALGFFLLGFLVLFYILLSSLLRKKEVSQTSVLPPVIIENESDYTQKLREYFKKLSDKKETLSSVEFYRYYNAGLREILMYEGYPEAQKSTLTELSSIKNIESHEVYRILSETYYKEFKQEDENNNIQQQGYIEKILSYLGT